MLVAFLTMLTLDLRILALEIEQHPLVSWCSKFLSTSGSLSILFPVPGVLPHTHSPSWVTLTRLTVGVLFILWFINIPSPEWFSAVLLPSPVSGSPLSAVIALLKYPLVQDGILVNYLSDICPAVISIKAESDSVVVILLVWCPA